MKEQATRLRGWIWRHKRRSSVILIVLLVGIGVGTCWTINLLRYGPRPPTGQNCGGILYDGVSQTARADANLKPLDCFWQAYQTCRAATISQTYAGTDAGHGDMLTIELRNNRCVLYGQYEAWVQADKSTATFLCTQLSKMGDNLQVSACDGRPPFALVASYIPQDSFPCGVVGSSSSIVFDTPQKIEECFFTAYQQCFDDRMGYQTLVGGVQVERDFYIDIHCGLAYQRGSYKASCASLEMRDDGLHFSQCGTDGDIFVPLVPSSAS